ncbi:MAG: LysR family transcriptional regulator [Clostridia bacterium]|nr:LysR family transcriptional regulator [Clostridia bacterium]
MNILHMKYAVEVANAGSINKASETLLVAQPNLSRYIKDLESDLGITIFDRSARGMVLTADGARFIGYAKKILAQIDEVEKMYKMDGPVRQKLTVCLPRASYVTDAFARFTSTLGRGPVDIYYKETDTMQVINNVQQEEYNLGIIRYAESYDRYFRTMLSERGLAAEQITEFRYVLLMRRDSSLAILDMPHYTDLRDFVEIVQVEPFVPSLPMAEVRKAEIPDLTDRHIYVHERASQFELLSRNPQTFMWVSPVPDATLERYGLVQLPCADNDKKYRDVLIYRKDYKLTELETRFIEAINTWKI